MSALLIAVMLTAYDPLVVPDAAPVGQDLTAGEGAETAQSGAAGRGRSDPGHPVPIRVYLPSQTTPAPVLLFSHGLGGSRENNHFLGAHWAKRGYVAVFLQHPGSDSAVWKDVAPAERMKSMKDAASLENFLARVGHVTRVLDTLAKWNTEPKHVLFGRLDLARVGMSGHSFGAVTTQAVSGQQFPLGQGFTDARIKAALALSPSVPRRGEASRAFGSVSIPWLLMTGTADASPIGGQTPASRLGVYPALPKGQKYELVLEGAEHSAFNERALPGDALPRSPNHHKVMLAISTAFFDSTLKADAAARAWLEGAPVKALLEKGDRWQWK